MDKQTLLTHGNAIAPILAVDPVIGSEFAEGKTDNARAEVLRLVENWDGRRAVVMDRHCFNVSRVEAEFVFHGDSHRSTPETQQQVERFSSLVPAAMIDESDDSSMRFGRVNMRSLLRHVKAGNSVFAWRRRFAYVPWR